MIDPITSLAFSMQSNKGVYALLIGSGVSRAAKIPTGWEITLDLIGKVAALEGAECLPSPEEWYRGKYGKEPSYSELLDALAKTPSERSQLVRGYIEPAVDETDDTARKPTKAHRSIAKLAKRGFVRVVVTTNFDRLLETALADEGVVPTVISSVDHVRGALPLIHTQCCVIKLHGDYLDTRILNTVAELDNYAPELNGLLDRVFDDFGLVVCGWSADWDGALRSALIRAPSRRFSMYWAQRGKHTAVADQLITRRAAVQVSIAGADEFFGSLEQKVLSLEEYSRPHPLSTQVAVASLKRFLSEHRFRIQLEDLVADEFERVGSEVSIALFPTDKAIGAVIPGPAETAARLRSYEAVCETLVTMAAVAGYWSDRDQLTAWKKGIARLSSQNCRSGFAVWIDLQRYPALLLFYALGMGAIEANRLNTLHDLFLVPMEIGADPVPAVQVMSPFPLLEQSKGVIRIDGRNERLAPLNDWLHDSLRAVFKTLVPSDEKYTLLFDKFEMLVSLGYAKHARRDGKYWAPAGAFGYRSGNRQLIVSEINRSLATMLDKSPYVLSGIFGRSSADCADAVRKLDEYASSWNW